MSHYQGDDCPKRHCPDIGLVGWMRSGKDSVADWLIEHYGYRKMGFATALKAEVAEGVDCHPEDLNKEPLKSQVRQVLQVWGTEFRRGQDPDYWVKMALEEIELRRCLFVCTKCGEEFAHLQPSHSRWAGRGEGPFTCEGHLRLDAHPLVFTDVRFQNEIDMLRDHGFLIVHVDMPVWDVATYFTERGMTSDEIGAMLSHPSEQEWQKAEVNERLKSKRGDLPGLYAQVKALVERHDGRISTIA